MHEERQSEAAIGETSPTLGTAVMDGGDSDLDPAPIFKRILAYIIDLSVLTAIFYPISFVGSLLFFGLFAAVRDQGDGIVGFLFIVLGGAAVLFLLATFHGYFILQEYRYSTTIGKRLFGLRVVSLNGRELSLSQCILREVMRLIDVCLLFPGLISIVASSRNRRLGDMVADTLVIHSAEQEAERDYLYMTQDDYVQWKERLNARPVGQLDCRDYLVLAFHCFIKRDRSPELNDAELQAWNQAVANYLPGAETSGLNRIELMQFYAEHCNQQLMRKSSGA